MVRINERRRRQMEARRRNRFLNNKHTRHNRQKLPLHPLIIQTHAPVEKRIIYKNSPGHFYDNWWNDYFWRPHFNDTISVRTNDSTNTQLLQAQYAALKQKNKALKAQSTRNTFLVLGGIIFAISLLYLFKKRR